MAAEACEGIPLPVRRLDLTATASTGVMLQRSCRSIATRLEMGKLLGIQKPSICPSQRSKPHTSVNPASSRPATDVRNESFRNKKLIRIKTENAKVRDAISAPVMEVPCESHNASCQGLEDEASECDGLVKSHSTETLTSIPTSPEWDTSLTIDASPFHFQDAKAVEAQKQSEKEAHVFDVTGTVRNRSPVSGSHEIVEGPLCDANTIQPAGERNREVQNKTAAGLLVPKIQSPPQNGASHSTTGASSTTPVADEVPKRSQMPTMKLLQASATPTFRFRASKDMNLPLSDSLRALLSKMESGSLSLGARDEQKMVSMLSPTFFRTENRDRSDDVPGVHGTDLRTTPGSPTAGIRSENITHWERETSHGALPESQDREQISDLPNTDGTESRFSICSPQTTALSDGALDERRRITVLHEGHAGTKESKRNGDIPVIGETITCPPQDTQLLEAGCFEQRKLSVFRLDVPKSAKLESPYLDDRTPRINSSSPQTPAHSDGWSTVTEYPSAGEEPAEPNLLEERAKLKRRKSTTRRRMRKMKLDADIRRMSKQRAALRGAVATSGVVLAVLIVLLAVMLGRLFSISATIAGRMAGGQVV